VVLVEPDAVKPEPIHLGPRVQVLFERARAYFRIETVAGQRVGQEFVGLGVLEMRPVRNEIEQKNLHRDGCP
jgi:hypothetical protein